MLLLANNLAFYIPESQNQDCKWHDMTAKPEASKYGVHNPVGNLSTKKLYLICQVSKSPVLYGVMSGSSFQGFTGRSQEVIWHITPYQWIAIVISFVFVIYIYIYRVCCKKMLVLYYIDFPWYQTIGWTTMCMISFSNNCALNTSTRIRPWTCNIKERTYLGTKELESLASLALGLLQLDGPQRRALQCSICVTHTCTDTRAHTHTQRDGSM